MDISLFFSLVMSINANSNANSMMGEARAFGKRGSKSYAYIARLLRPYRALFLSLLFRGEGAILVMLTVLTPFDPRAQFLLCSRF